jgi:hypothetical protein
MIDGISKTDFSAKTLVLNNGMQGNNSDNLFQEIINPNCKGLISWKNKGIAGVNILEINNPSSPVNTKSSSSSSSTTNSNSHLIRNIEELSPVENKVKFGDYLNDLGSLKQKNDFSYRLNDTLSSWVRFENK